MRVSLEWLNEYMDLSGISPEQIAEALTASGLEVEDVDTQGPRFSGVILGKVLALAPHPNADKLRLVTVDLGDAQTQVVCGAPNVREGLLIAFAQEGATVLDRKTNTPFVLGRAKIRGVESAGMICSLDELGLDDRYSKTEDGIWPLNDRAEETQLGRDLKQVLGLAGETILHTAPTANRGDLMCLQGVVRELAALFNRPCHARPSAIDPPKPEPNAPYTIAELNPAVCQYYGALLLNQIQVGPSPEWLSRRLQAAGVRSINNVVDITNYVMLEMGQPLHAFDQDRLNPAGPLGVRHARAGETLTTLDGIERSFSSDETVVVTHQDAPIALAGVMGGQATEVTEATHAILLESAYFPAASTRKSAKSVGLRSEASARFERGVDRAQCRAALLRAAHLLQAHAGGIVSGFIESKPDMSLNEPEITLRLSQIERILGLDIESHTVQTLLNALGFVITGCHQDHLTVRVPSFRAADVTREIDLIEEIIRIHGYDRVPYTLPQKSNAVRISSRSQLLTQTHQSMRAQGFQEVMTTSLIGPSLLEKTGFQMDAQQLVSVLNSHSSDHTMLRQSLLPNLLEIAKFNQAQGNDTVWLYELGRTFFKLGKATHKQAGVSERLTLSGLLTGQPQAGAWQTAPALDFYRAKGALENLFDKLGLSDRLSMEAESDIPWLHPGKAAKITLIGKPVGFLGELHPLRQKNLKFRQPVYVFEINMEQVYKQLKQTQTVSKAIKLSPYPSVDRDMAFVAPGTLTHQEIVRLIHGLDDPLLQHITLFDEYRSEQLGDGQRSLAYRLTFRSDAGTLTDQDVDQSLQRIKTALSERLPVQFR